MATPALASRSSMAFLSSLPRLLPASAGLLLAALGGSALSTGVGSALEVEDGRPAQADASIVEHNPFCPSCREIERDKARAPSEQRMGPAPSGLPLELVATMVTVPAADSVAIIAHSQTEHSAPFGVHDHVRKDVVVKKITRTRVVLSNAGSLEFLDLNGRYCTARNPCDEGTGNCEGDDQCLPGLVCGPDLGALYRLPEHYAICVPAKCSPNPKKPMSTSFCSATCRCTSGMGDCDSDDQCLPHHVCVDDNGRQFGKPKNWDICMHV